MKKKIFAIVGGMLALMIVSCDLQAQNEELVPQYNPNSVNPIPIYEQLYKVTVWRRVSLREKQNKGLFALNSELSKIIIDGVKSGEINHIYTNDSLTTEMTKEDFLSGMRLYAEDVKEEFIPWDATEQFYEGEIVTYNDVDYMALEDTENQPPDQNPEIWRVEVAEQEEYGVRDVDILNIKEDVIFDKRRARVYNDIQSIELFVNGNVTVETFNKPLGVFAYKELEEYFRRRPDICIWYNQYNSAQNKNLADAFLLRLFHGNIIKYENPDNLLIEQIYPGKRAPLFAADWFEMQLMEKEHNLWSY